MAGGLTYGDAACACLGGRASNDLKPAGAAQAASGGTGPLWVALAAGAVKDTV